MRLRYAIKALLALPVIAIALAPTTAQNSPPRVDTRTVTVYTFDIPPYTIYENGKFSGAAIDMVRAIFTRAKIPYTIKLLPFTRAYNTTQNSPDSFVLPISKLPKREKDFEWIGTMLPSPMSVFTLESRTDIRICTLDDMRSYRIGTVQNDSREHYLLDHGFPLGSMQRLSGADPYERNIRKLAMRRIDLLPIPDYVFIWLCRKTGTDLKQFRNAYRLEELSSLGYSMAASHGVRKDVLEKIRTELVRFRKSPDYTAILAKYGMRERSVIP